MEWWGQVEKEICRQSEDVVYTGTALAEPQDGADDVRGSLEPAPLSNCPVSHVTVVLGTEAGLRLTRPALCTDSDGGCKVGECYCSLPRQSTINPTMDSCNTNITTSCISWRLLLSIRGVAVTLGLPMA